jgi:predicted DNA-binding WGR domain protein
VASALIESAVESDSQQDLAMAEPLQLPLFPDQASLIRIRPERNEWRYYRLAVWPDLFGRALLARHWGRIGTQGRIRLDPHPDTGAAINALARMVRSKRRRGYWDRLSEPVFEIAERPREAGRASLSRAVGLCRHRGIASRLEGEWQAKNPALAAVTGRGGILGITPLVD